MGWEPRPRFKQTGLWGHSRRGRARRDQRRRRQGWRIGCVQELEPRAMLSTFTVTDTLDDGNPGSLRWAINQVNADTGTGVDTIDFDIAGTGPFTIVPSSALPTITHAVLIDGYSQPGASANTQATSDNAILMIDLGSGTASFDGLDISAGDSTVQGLAINGFNNGIQLEPGSTGDLIQGNFIGTDVTGTYQASNDQGILVNGTSGNTIGGTTPAARNVVSGNFNQDIFLAYGASGNLVEGNFVGLTASGTSTLYTGGNGVIAYYSPDNTVGGTVAGAGNVIGGLASDGIQFGGSNDCLAEGNFIGTDPTGTIALPNAQGVGIRYGATDDTIGGTTPGSGNLISGNGTGVLIPYYTDGNVIEGNLIGTDVTGTNAPAQHRAGRGDRLRLLEQHGRRHGRGRGQHHRLQRRRRGRRRQRFGRPGRRQRHPVQLDLRQRRPGHRPGRRRRHPEHPGRAAQRPQRPPELPRAVPGRHIRRQHLRHRDAQQRARARPSPCSSSPTPRPTPAATARARALIGTTTVTTDANGNASFIASFPGVVPAGQAVSATATDPTGDTSEFAQDVTVAATTSPVVAVNDTYNVDENSTLTVPAPGVLANDYDLTGGTLSAVLVTTTSDGSLSLQPDGAFTYTPDAGFVGTDTFTYYDTDGTYQSNVATVTINVNPKTSTRSPTRTTAGPARSARRSSAPTSPARAPPDTILFDIPGTGPFTIAPLTPLPTLTHATIIDGYSQPGASPNTLASGDNAVIEIQLSGGQRPGRRRPGHRRRRQHGRGACRSPASPTASTSPTPPAAT